MSYMVQKKLIQSGKSTITLVSGSAVNIATVEFPKLFVSKPVVVITLEFISSPIIIPDPPFLFGTTFDVTETGFKAVLGNNSGASLINGSVYKINWIARGTGEWIEPIHPCIPNCYNNDCFNCNCCNNFNRC